MSGVPPYYSLTHGHVSCWPGTESHGQVWAQINAKVWEMYMYISSFPALSYHYKIQHLSLILLAKLLLFFLPFFSLLSSIFLARISLIRSKNTWKKKKKRRGCVFFVCSLSQSLHLHSQVMTTSSSQTYLVHIGAGFGRSLHIAHAPLFGACLCFVCADLPPVVQVGLVPDQEKGHVFVLLHSQNLLSVKRQMSFRRE